MTLLTATITAPTPAVASAACAALLCLLTSVSYEEDGCEVRIKGEIAESDLPAAIAAVESAGAELACRLFPAESQADAAVEPPVSDYAEPNDAEPLASEPSEAAPDAPPAPMAIPVTLRFSGDGDLVTASQKLAFSLAGQIGFADPATGWNGDDWCLYLLVADVSAFLAACPAEFDGAAVAIETPDAAPASAEPAPKKGKKSKA
jgi:hypothetical protein